VWLDALQAYAGLYNTFFCVRQVYVGPLYTRGIEASLIVAAWYAETISFTVFHGCPME